ncbi:hypothetical protein FFZ99_17660 [Leptospira interrogans]|uniref:Uncharacterized protein n=1 Tax=Leptospira interrogans serovar Canicola TaxID=211880 RepID=A0AAP9WBM3_LEPIR|nr:hypothetical protein C4X99_02535 [Leptospira interrogans serovar Geyaweera]QCO36909.1 hypothetical protein E4412_06555 [Leptospira interrogans]QOI34989.1 hypothetical protein LeptoLang_12715 [Leptospira interrogans serovar Icterohaemorrhagiae]QOI42092.1 hypothetical protein Lepto782_07315 [Leptospira interrogans serovar Canicola]TQE56192.1 hypothetical protein FF006_13825 [Leptospira interrogans]
MSFQYDSINVSHSRNLGISNSKRYSILIFFSSFYKDDFLEKHQNFFSSRTRISTFKFLN